MGERIVVEPVTRIEGHARITVQLDDSGAVSGATLHVTEFRGFEKLCEGRPFTEMPGLMSRICGICPISHVLAAARAGDQILGVGIPEAARLQRRLLTYAQVLQSHALSFFHLSAPDLLLGFDADPERRHVFGLLESEPDLMRRGIRLRALGQQVIEDVAGKRIHPSWGVPGGVSRPAPESVRQRIRDGAPEAHESIRMALDRMKQLLDGFRDEIDGIGNFPSLFLGSVDEDGALEYVDGRIRIVDGERNTVADQLDPGRYATYLAEASEASSYMKFPYYKPLGYPGGMYRVGPLARLNVAERTGTPLADRELRELRQRGQEAVTASFHYHLARLVEMLHCVERLEELCEEPELTGTHVRARAGVNAHVGVGSCEAPRGTLFHRYEVDDDGLVQRADLLIATSQNNLAMNRTVEQAARRFVRPDALAQGMLNRVEAGIRCYDPCLSCATHALGSMPLQVEVRAADGALCGHLAR